MLGQELKLARTSGRRSVTSEVMPAMSPSGPETSARIDPSWQLLKVYRPFIAVPAEKTTP